MAEEQLALSSVPEKQDAGEKDAGKENTGKENTGKENTGKENRPVVIRVKNLYKIYRVGDIKVRALDGLDFDIYKGESLPSWGPPVPANPPFSTCWPDWKSPPKGRLRLAGSI